jgi:CYTH domain-containing protein
MARWTAAMKMASVLGSQTSQEDAMPVENERKYVLSPGFDAGRLKGWQEVEIRQAYLDDGPRIRQIGADFIFTYKKWAPHAGELVEIETPISREDFELLWPLRVQSVQKTRHIKVVGDEEWVVDFLRDDAGDVFFVLAEVELPRFQAEPRAVVDEIADFVLYAVAADDNRFTNKKLADRDYALGLLAQVAAEVG